MTKDPKTDAIVKRTIELFSNSSFDELTVMDICKANNITKPTFYKYIGSKEALLELYYQERMDALSEEWLKEEDHSMDHFIQGILLPVACAQEIGSTLYRSFFQTMLRRHSFKHELFYPVHVRLIKEASLLQEEGLLSDAIPPETLVEMIYGMQLGTSMDWLENRGDFPLVERFLKQNRAMFTLKE